MKFCLLFSYASNTFELHRYVSIEKGSSVKLPQPRSAQIWLPTALKTELYPQIVYPFCIVNLLNIVTTKLVEGAPPIVIGP